MAQALAGAAAGVGSAASAGAAGLGKLAASGAGALGKGVGDLASSLGKDLGGVAKAPLGQSAMSDNVVMAGNPVVKPLPGPDSPLVSSAFTPLHDLSTAMPSKMPTNGADAQPSFMSRLGDAAATRWTSPGTIAQTGENAQAAMMAAQQGQAYAPKLGGYDQDATQQLLAKYGLANDPQSLAALLKKLHGGG